MKKLVLVLGLLVTSGCGSHFYQHTDGEDDLVGIRLPVEEDITLDILHHINGSQLKVKYPSAIRHSYAVTNSNTYFGCIKVCEWRSGDILVNPTNKLEGVSK